MCRTQGLSIGTDWYLEGSKIEVIVFDVKFVKNGNSYDVRPNRDYTYYTWASLRMILRGYSDRHVGIFASVDNWRTCLIFEDIVLERL